MFTIEDMLLCIIAVLCPPFTVWIKRGICSADSFLNILLSLVGYVPGLIHAWYIIIRYPEPSLRDIENNSVTYVVVNAPTESQHGAVHGSQYPPVHGSQYPPVHGFQNPSAALTKAQGSLNYGTSGPAPPLAGRATRSSRAGSAGRSSSSSPTPRASSSSRRRQQSQQPEDNGEGQSGSPPPSYYQTVGTDHKIQTRD